jgi:hypothetical protein
MQNFHVFRVTWTNLLVALSGNTNEREMSVNNFFLGNGFFVLLHCTSTVNAFWQILKNKNGRQWQPHNPCVGASWSKKDLKNLQSSLLVVQYQT